MNYEELSNRVLLLKQEKRKLENDYINSMNEKYRSFIREKVEVKGMKLFFLGFYLDSCHTIRPVFNRIKKDGTMSSVSQGMFFRFDEYDNLPMKLLNEKEG